MSRLDTQRNKIFAMIAKTDNMENVKLMASLLTRTEELSSEEKKLASAEARVQELKAALASDMVKFKALEADRPKSNRGRRKKAA